MDYLQLVKDTLDRLLLSLPGEEEQKFPKAHDALVSLCEMYKKLHTGKPIDYHDPYTRFAYVLTFFSVRAYAIERVFLEVSSLRDNFVKGHHNSPG
jgi:hypothetical protein